MSRSVRRRVGTVAWTLAATLPVLAACVAAPAAQAAGPVPASSTLSRAVEVPSYGPNASASANASTMRRAAESSPVRRCTSLVALHVPDVTVTAATADTSGSFTVPEGQGGIGEDKAGTVYTGLPAFCRVEVTTTNPPAHDQIHVEVWLPLTTWNSRFQGVGGGGFVSGISYRALKGALEAHYATASTDTGHPAIQGDGSFALDANAHLQQAEITDFAYRAIHEMTVVSKVVTTRFYGTAADFSYFDGCSMGGRQAVTEAERYPHDYDGIVAGSSAVDFARLSPAQLWPQFVMLRAGDFVPQCKFAAFQQAAISTCDDLDGVTDGVIGDMPACHFDPRTLVGRSTPCGTITRTDASVMAQIWQGPRTGVDGKGRRLWYGLERGSSMRLLAASDETGGLPLYIGTSWFRYWLTQNPAYDWKTLTTSSYIRLFARGVERFDELDSDDPDLSRFQAAGGKLLMWTGLADQLIPPKGSVHYYEEVVRRSGGARKVRSFARLFLAPGVGHCALTDNVGPVPTGQLGALRTWVEHGLAPARLLATKTDATGHVESRPLCPYPLLARYSGHGSTDDAANFDCGRP